MTAAQPLRWHLQAWSFAIDRKSAGRNENAARVMG
jgi:hypothetical protein